MARFTEDQTFSPAIAGLSFLLLFATNIVILATGALAAPDAALAKQPPLIVTLLVLPATGAAFIAAFTMAFRLRTRVEEDRLIFGFPLGLRRTIPLDQIRSAEAVTYRPLRDFGGWGLRFGSMGMMYNARGDRAVRLHLKNGKVVFVGSQTPEELVRAISSET